MRTFTAKEIEKAVNGKMISGFTDDFPVYSLSTDSREAGPKDVFFALVGKTNNAHDYIGQVLDNGCMVLVISEADRIPKEKFLGQAGDPIFILVEDTTKALQDLSRYYLNTLPLKYKLAVTGSVGKTSTRDMLYAISSVKYKTSKCIKNFNNVFGLPRSIMEFSPDTEVAVIEMGMSVKGSIEVLSELTRPDMGLITNIGMSHIMNFPEEGRMGILNTKLEMTKYFDEKAKLVINADNDILCDLDSEKANAKLIKVGSKDEYEYIVSDVKDFGDEGVSYTLTHDGKTYEVSLPVAGAHNAINSALAIAMGVQIGIEIPEAIIGLKNLELTGNRLNIKEKDGIKVIDDTYNASSESMKSAMNTLISTKGERKVAMLGEIRELGEEISRAVHFDIGHYAGEKKIDMAIFIGSVGMNMIEGWLKWNEENGYNTEKIVEMPLIYRNDELGIQAEYFPEKEMVMEGVKKHLKSGDVVLVKASNSIHLDKIVEKILE